MGFIHICRISAGHVALLHACTDTATGTLSRLRYLVLKNYAHTLGDSYQALHAYGQVAAQVSSDASLWYRISALAAKLGAITVAMHAAMEGMRCAPQNVQLHECLLQLLAACDDRLGVMQALARLNQLGEYHPW